MADQAICVLLFRSNYDIVLHITNRFLTKGGVYGTDRGAEPDIYINDINKIYDRKYVNSVLDGLR